MFAARVPCACVCVRDVCVLTALSHTREHCQKRSSDKMAETWCNTDALACMFYFLLL